MPTRLDANALRRRIDPGDFPFETTAELPPAHRPLGQARVRQALAFGLGMTSPGYNVFVLGAPGAGKRSTVVEVLEEAAARRPPPADWVYVHNFQNPEAPVALSLPAGLGSELKHDVKELVGSVVSHLPKASGQSGQKRASELAQAGLRRGVAALETKYGAQGAVVAYLKEMEHDLLGSLLAPSLPLDLDDALRYRVHLFVSHGGRGRAPVVFETNPTYPRLVGHVEHRLVDGSLVTDFTRVEPGALHRASGGYLVLDARDLVAHPSAYEALKRVLHEGTIRLDELGDAPGPVGVSLRPAPIPVDVKVVLLGTPEIYYLLFEYDEDFGKFFKVKGEFVDDVELNDESRLAYACLVAHRCTAEGLLPFHRDAVAQVVEQGLRAAEYQNRLTANFLAVADLVREAEWWARRENQTVVRAAHVTRAVDERVRQHDSLEETVGRMIEEGSILIDTEGTAVGQANGLSVYDTGDYAFGKPSRLTAKVFLGREGVINIEREADLAGRIHNKGVLILQGYFGSRYAQKFPISFAATLCFEQSYGGVEGDSASSVELFALLSALAEVPLRQDLAVTGSVNQMGQIQAVGGINLKIEGFYKTCQVRGLTGTQGVIIPRANVRNLMLDEEVVDAVERGEFHIYAVSSVEEGMDLLSGIPAGEANLYGEFPEGTLNAKITRRLERLSRQWKKLHAEE